MNYIRTKVKLKVIHTLKEVQLCRFSTTITPNDHVFLAILSSLLTNFQKISIYYLFILPIAKEKNKLSVLYRSNKGGFACCTPLLTTYCKQKNDIPVPKKRMKLYPQQYKIEFFRNRNNIINYNSIIEL